MIILCLHSMGNPASQVSSVAALENMLSHYSGEHQCIVHDTLTPFPNYLKQVDFDLVVLGPTFLGARISPSAYAKTLKNYSFIKELQAVKIALPQDEYDCSALLDDWMVDWEVDRVHTIFPENSKLLYPEYSRIGEFRRGHTGYIYDEWLDAWSVPKPLEDRSIDVSYRASRLSANFGSTGFLKSEIAGRFLDRCQATDFNFDISTDPKNFIRGDLWHSFLEDSKSVLVTPSGSSLHDPHGNIRERVKIFTSEKPDASFEEIEFACFEGLDNWNLFTAISPRNVEAALLNTVQIATPGAYSGWMEPMIHYIPLMEDCSNSMDVLDMLNDRPLLKTIAANCRELFLDIPELRAKTIIEDIFSYAKLRRSGDNNLGSQHYQKLKLRHDRDMRTAYRKANLRSKFYTFIRPIFQFNANRTD